MNTEMNNEMEQLSRWLNTCRNQPLFIVKHEQGDKDEVALTLRDAKVSRSRKPSPDDYIGNETLLLQGNGTVYTDDEQLAPLPGDVYEIPLAGNWQSEEIGNTLHITTERANYTITPQASQSQVH